MDDRPTLEKWQDLRGAIDRDIAKRIRKHQRIIKKLKAERPAISEGAAASRPKPLVMLALGDSWFDYPLNGNEPSDKRTDIIAQLIDMGSPKPVILNLSHFGDPTTVELSIEKQVRMKKALQDPDNWLDGKPDAILFSGGGDDVAGNQFCIFLNFAGDNRCGGLNEGRFRGVLDMITASYSDLFVFRDHFANGVPIFGHCYDFAIPKFKPHPACVGPWLAPSLEWCGWTLEEGKEIIRETLTRFRTMLLGLQDSKKYKFTMVDTQNVLAEADWANELHPHPSGFNRLVQTFVKALQGKFRGRI